MLDFAMAIVAALAGPVIVGLGVALQVLLVNFARTIGVDPAQVLLAEVVVVPMVAGFVVKQTSGASSPDPRQPRAIGLKTTSRPA